ncbi:hypothetical protein OAM77_05435 [Alphaproteobacteria bacterium]|nr:hypothetical protein [Alphaproteobacteria bacterium]
MTYQVKLNEHLAQYRREVLGVKEAGKWANPRTGLSATYEHILPDGYREKNICSPFRDRFWHQFREWAEKEPSHVVRLHRNFSHLNSSQALCFNLFYPLIADHNWALNFVHDVLSLPKERPRRQAFEWVEDPEEETNYDFFIQMQSGRKLFFEVKLSEVGFGTTKADAEHLAKLTRIYEPKLRKLVDGKWLEAATFCARYQLLRNMSHLTSKDHLLFFVVPKANSSLKKSLEELPRITNGPLNGRVRVLYLEDLVSKITELLGAADGPLKDHYFEVKRKYVI